MYGEKRSTGVSKFKGHVAQLATSVEELSKMEKLSQSMFLKMVAGTDRKWLL